MSAEKSIETTSTTSEDVTSQESLSSLLSADGGSPGDNKRVRFTTMEIRDYPIILGNNPAVGRGPPLTIDWQYEDLAVFSVDEYEARKPKRRGKRNLLIPVHIRELWIRCAGYSFEDMDESIQEVIMTKQSRAANANKRMMRYRLEESTEVVQKTVQKWIRRGAHKHRDEEQ